MSRVLARPSLPPFTTVNSLSSRSTAHVDSMTAYQIAEEKKQRSLERVTRTTRLVTHLKDAIQSDDYLTAFDIFMDASQLGTVHSFVDGTRLIQLLARKGRVREMFAAFEVMRQYGFCFETHALVLDRMLFALARERHAPGVYAIAAELDSMAIPLGDESYERLVYAYFSIRADDRAFKLLDTYRAAGAPVSRLMLFALYNMGSTSSGTSIADCADRQKLAENLPRKLLGYIVGTPGANADEVAAVLCHAMRNRKNAGVLVEALSMRAIVELAPPALLEACLAFLLLSAHGHHNRLMSPTSPHARLTLQEFMDGVQLTEDEMQERSFQLLDALWPGGAEAVLVAAEEEITAALVSTQTLQDPSPSQLHIGASLDARVLLDEFVPSSPEELLARRLDALAAATGDSFVTSIAPTKNQHEATRASVSPAFGSLEVGTAVTRGGCVVLAAFTSFHVQLSDMPQATTGGGIGSSQPDTSRYMRYAIAILTHLDAIEYDVNRDIRIATFQVLAIFSNVLPAAQLAVSLV